MVLYYRTYKQLLALLLFTGLIFPCTQLLFIDLLATHNLSFWLMSERGLILYVTLSLAAWENSAYPGLNIWRDMTRNHSLSSPPASCPSSLSKTMYSLDFHSSAVRRCNSRNESSKIWERLTWMAVSPRPFRSLILSSSWRKKRRFTSKSRIFVWRVRTENGPSERGVEDWRKIWFSTARWDSANSMNWISVTKYF